MIGVAVESLPFVQAGVTQSVSVDCGGRAGGGGEGSVNAFRMVR